MEPGGGFDTCEGVEDGVQGGNMVLFPFLQWVKGMCRFYHSQEAIRGWDALKLYVEIKELEDVIAQAKVEAEQEPRWILRPRSVRSLENNRAMVARGNRQRKVQ